MEKTNYCEPEVEVLFLTEEDIIATSGNNIEMDEEEFIIPKNQ